MMRVLSEVDAISFIWRKINLWQKKQPKTIANSFMNVENNLSSFFEGNDVYHTYVIEKYHNWANSSTKSINNNSPTKVHT